MDSDSFMLKFKYYKSNKPKPSLNDVISVVDNRFLSKVQPITESTNDDPRIRLLGLKACNKWKSYTFVSHPGLYLIENPFTSIGQRYWIRKCLEQYPRKPNKRNIDIEFDIEDWWEACHLCEGNEDLIKKLRWTTLGYHHNWDTKVYSEENRTKFPVELAELSDVVAVYLNYTAFKAEAAIVNYYHMKSTLSAHTDHSEVNLEAPLFSFSFGQSAIFLIGGQGKSISPTPILLQSGDIIVMSKEARLCYHAVPKILPAPSSAWNEDVMSVDFHSVPIMKYVNNVNEIVYDMNKNLDDTEWTKFNDYVQASRINMNVRQVLNDRQLSLDPVVTKR